MKKVCLPFFLSFFVLSFSALEEKPSHDSLKQVQSAEFSVHSLQHVIRVTDSLFPSDKITNLSELRGKTDQDLLKQSAEFFGSGILAEKTIDSIPSSTQSSLAAESGFPGITHDADHHTAVKTMESQFIQNMIFDSGRNAIQMLVPFTYDWSINRTTGLNQITNIRPSTRPIQLLPVGSYWSPLSQVSGSVEGVPSSRIHAAATAEEAAVILYSTQGETWLGSKSSVGSLRIGDEFREGFTIKSFQNMVNQFSMTANGKISISVTSEAGLPSTRFEGTIQGLQYRIFQN